MSCVGLFTCVLRIADHSEPVFECAHLKHMHARTFLHRGNDHLRTQVNRTVCLNGRQLRTTFYICWNVGLRVRRLTIRDCYSIRLHFVFLTPCTLNGSLFLSWCLPHSLFNTHTTARLNAYTYAMFAQHTNY